MPQYIDEGLDPTPLSCIDKSDLLQMIRAAKPATGYGFVVMSDSAPDVVTYPELARFIWLKSVADVPNGEFYYYNGTSWALLSLVGGNLIANNSIPLSKISLTGSSPYYILQVNSAGNALVWISVVNAIQNNSIPLSKLVNGTSGNKFLTSLSGVNAFSDISAIVGYLSDNSLAISKLIRGDPSAHGLFLRTFEDGSVAEWVDFDPNEQIENQELLLSKLAPTGGVSGQAIRLNTGGNAFEFYTPITSDPKKLVYITDQVASGGASPAIAFGVWTTRRLQTINNPDGIASLAANQITLEAGNYMMWFQMFIAQAYCRVRLRNITAGITLAQSVNATLTNNDSGLVTMSAPFNLAVPSLLEIQYYAVNQGGVSNQLGVPMATGDDEIYASLLIHKK